eukprot:GCRY01003444.1.p1 GENE.GCRY01003444.1~~GCRY01003444.1.p1  ORF type:complete len:380 (+),score=85.19 GCRY01003444.1:208-1347(+)
MNISVEGSDKNYITLNQTASRLGVGYKKGYKIFDIKRVENDLKLLGDDSSLGSVGKVELHYDRRLLMLSGAGDNIDFGANFLRVYDCQKKACILSFSAFESSILAIKCNEIRLVVVLEKKIFVYDKQMRQMTVLPTDNPLGLVSLATAGEQSALVYPAARDSGVILAYDIVQQRPLCEINAHENALACVVVNREGTLVASASKKGTLIRVFALPSGDKLMTLRRGSKDVSIRSMAFNWAPPPPFIPLSATPAEPHTAHTHTHTNAEEADASQPTRLAVLTKSGSLHVFTLKFNEKAPGGLSSLLSMRFSSLIDGTRADCIIYIPKQNPEKAEKEFDGIVGFQPSGVIVVVTADSHLYYYTLVHNDSGELLPSLIKERTF